MSDEVWQKLSGQLQFFTPLSGEALSAFRKIWKEESRSRKEILTSAGEVERYMYYVVSGTQRIYHINELGRESTIVLMYENDFGGVLDSMILGLPSKFFYETLSKSTLVKCSIHDIRALIKDFPEIKSILEKGAAFALSGIMERMVEMQSLTIEERYRKMMKRSAHVLQLIPHKYIANYLGIDPTNFSKLINSVRI